MICHLTENTKQPGILVLWIPLHQVALWKVKLTLLLKPFLLTSGCTLHMVKQGNRGWIKWVMRVFVYDWIGCVQCTDTEVWILWPWIQCWTQWLRKQRVFVEEYLNVVNIITTTCLYIMCHWARQTVPYSVEAQKTMHCSAQLGVPQSAL